MITCITKDNREFIIRQPSEEDAEKVLLYSRMMFAATDKVLTTPQDFKNSNNGIKRSPDL